MTLLEIAKKLEELAYELRKLADGEEKPKEPTPEQPDVVSKDELNKSYAQNIYYQGKKVLEIFADKKAKSKSGEKFYSRLYLRKATNHELFSLDFSKEDIKNKKFANELTYTLVNNSNALVIGEEGDIARIKAKKFAGLDEIYQGKIMLRYLGEPVEVLQDNVSTGGIIVECGIIIDDAGFAKPYVENVDEKNHPGRMVRVNNGIRESIVKARDIEVTLE